MFQFKLKAVLNYKQQIEDVFQQEFAQSRKAWEHEKEKLERYYDHWRKYLDEWRSQQNDGVHIVEIELYQRYMLRMREEIRKQAEKVKECINIMDQKRERLMHAQKERKMMEKLEEYQQAEYNNEQARKETRFLDEVATQRFNYKGGTRHE